MFDAIIVVYVCLEYSPSDKRVVMRGVFTKKDKCPPPLKKENQQNIIGTFFNAQEKTGGVGFTNLVPGGEEQFHECSSDCAKSARADMERLMEALKDLSNPNRPPRGMRIYREYEEGCDCIFRASDALIAALEKGETT